MIASLRGRVGAVAQSAVVVDVGGVGYLVNVPASVLAGLRAGEAVSLLTHLVVREDSMTLYGFSSADQRDVFQALIGVTGVGPKIALAVLSAFEPDALRRAVAAGDVDALTTVPGIGKRGAQRMVLELRERLVASAEVAAAPGSKVAEVREALASLGYSPSELRGVIDRVAASEAPVEELVRAALRELSRL